MYQSAFKRGRLPRLIKVAASSAILAFGLASCQTTASSDVTGSLGEKAEANASSDIRRDVDAARDRYKANPQDTAAVMAYGKALRANGERSQAVAVLEQAALGNPKNKPLLAAYGRALADNGDFQRAFDVLSQAHTPEDPDWRILSAQGAVLDQLGKFEEARQYYASALKIVPDEPSVLSNLGMSYLLSKDLAKAETTLGRAYEHAKDDPRLRMNFAVVLSLEGRQTEAENLLKAGLSPDEGNARVAELKRLLIKKDGGKPERSASRAPGTTSKPN
jgi:Flp pilus assembly protein TadD